ncbi:MAG: ATP-binding protein, partial [Pseudobdellovibrionaceae bacterium]
SWVATKLAQLNGLFVIDELDVLASSADRARIAELLKHLSDAGSGFKILLVGIAETGAELMRGHPSVERCLRETKLNRMADKELRLILTNGEKELKLRFDSKAKDKIVAVSSGYPHFTHLLALKAAEDAIAESRSLISVEHIALATERAVGDSEGSLKRLYDDACRSHGSDKYRRIVCAAAVLGSEEFTAKALRLQYSNLYGSAIDQQSINNCFGRLCSDNSTTILRRIAKGVYRFNDPRMPSFIRMANVKYLN